MGATDLFPLVDKALDGQLIDRLTAWRSAGVSYDAIARELHAEGVAVSGETVRKWCLDRLPEHEAEQAAAS